MSLTYFKRYQMEIDLFQGDLDRFELCEGYRFLPWDDPLLEAHARVKYQSFNGELDANVFPCFREPKGCLRLMRSIVQRSVFLPEATWLVVYDGAEGNCPIPASPIPVGTVQGIDGGNGSGTIQNLGIVPEHRGVGIGTALLFKALAGFREVGLDRATLEVTAENRAAVRLYRRLGFRKTKVVYKSIEIVDA